MKILVLTTEPLPLPGVATTGAGLRAWGLMEGLRSAGFDVIIGTPLHGDDDAPTELAPEFAHVRFFRRDAIGALIHEVQPDVVVLQHWGIAAEVPELQVPLVIDLAGPHLLERAYWGSANPERDLEEKLSALRRADFITVSGEFQRHYFYPYLMMAGYDLATPPPVIPFSLPPEQPATPPRPDRELTFIYGGAFLAWQDPTGALTWLLEEMDAAGKGRLLFYGGTHPVLDASAGKFAELVERLRNHPRVEMRGWLPFDDLIQEYAAEGDVALDLMARNPERELAFTTRTMVYLHCGLPVIYNNYSEVSRIIEQGQCGWTLDPTDEIGFRSLVRRLLSGEVDLCTLGANARTTAAGFTWDKTIPPLAEFCRNPRQRPGKTEKLLAAEAARRAATVSSPSVPAWRLRLRPGRFVAPWIYLLMLPVRLYLWVKLRNTAVDKLHG